VAPWILQTSISTTHSARSLAKMLTLKLRLSDFPLAAAPEALRAPLPAKGFEAREDPPLNPPNCPGK